MKCPHCGQEHPDNYSFCPVIGQKIAPQFKACSNEQCSDYGKYILPLDSNFCPSCGHPIGGSSESASMDSDILEFEVEDVCFKMILVEHGHFMMGATSEQKDPFPSEKPVHEVTLTKDYYMGETQVTQALWEAVMGNNPSEFKGEERPVECVSWNDCQEFIRKLNRKLRGQLHGKSFRLPTEAEWEFAARGGNNSCGYRYSGSDDLAEVADLADLAEVVRYIYHCGNKTFDVASFAPNELGIYDMSGNVMEWCHDWFGSYNRFAQTDPQGPLSGSDRVNRGGSWNSDVWLCRLSCRGHHSPGCGSYDLGLRLALSE